MMERYITSLSTALGIAIAIALVLTLACGGTAAPAEEPASGGTGTAGSGAASATSGSGAGSGTAGSGQPQATAALATATPRPTIAPDATPTPLPAALPSEVVANPVTKDAYPDAQWGGTLRRGGYVDPAHYDLMQVSSVSNSFKQMMLLNNLLRYNPLDAGRTIVADIAVNWEVSEDGKTWTFPLRENVMFHDGTIMNADDVAASWGRVIDPPAGVVSARKGLYTPFGPAIEVIDPQTVAFNFEVAPPLNYGLNLFALEWHGVFPKAFLEANNYDLKVNGLTAPGTGAFRFLEHQEGEVWKNERFPDYWNEGLPYLDEVWTYPLGSSVNRSAALLAGNVEYAQTVDPAAFELLQNDDRYEAQPFSSYSYFAVWFNTDKEPWNDPRVRKAMWLSIDRDALHEVVSEWLFGYRGGTGWTFPDQAYELPQTEIDQRLVFNREAAEAEAKRLFEEAGYSDGIDNVDLMQRDWGGSLIDMVRCRIYLEIYEREGILEHARKMGRVLLEGLRKLAEESPALFSNARGVGPFCAIDLPDTPTRDRFLRSLFRRSLIILPSGERSIRFRPALNMPEEDVAEGLEIFRETSRDF